MYDTAVQVTEQDIFAFFGGLSVIGIFICKVCVHTHVCAYWCVSHGASVSYMFSIYLFIVYAHTAFIYRTTLY
jgi:hypothetical protein